MVLYIYNVCFYGECGQKKWHLETCEWSSGIQGVGVGASVVLKVMVRAYIVSANLTILIFVPTAAQNHSLCLGGTVGCFSGINV